MAPPKAELHASQKITNFFARFAVPKDRRPDPDVIEDEIVVASSRSNSQPSTRSPSVSTLPAQKRKRGEEHAADQSCGSTAQSGRSSNHVVQEGAATPASRGQSSANGVDGAVNVAPTLHSRDDASNRLQPVMADSPKAPSWSPLTDRTKSVASPGPALPAPNFRSTTAIIARSTPLSSTSALSTAPKSSAPSTIAPRSSTSSRRIMKDGLKAIANSDSDSGMSDDSSDGGLADARSFFAKRCKTSPEPSKPAAAPKSSRLSDISRWKKPASSMPKSPPRKVYKHSLASLSREGQRMREAEAEIASMKQAVEESKNRQLEAERQAAGGVEVAGDAAALLERASDDDEAERRVKALQRVEALHATDDYHFFLDSEPLFPDAPFPVEALSNEPWSSLYATDTSREQACISGFAAEMVVHFPLPMAITNWLAHQLLHEQNETLCEAYVDVLRASSAHPEHMSDTIASLSSMYKTRSLFEHNWKDPVRRGLPAGLKHILKVVQICAPASDSMVPEAEPLKTIEAFLDLAMMSLDGHVRQDVGLSLTLDNCIEELLDSLHDDAFEKLVAGVLGMLDETERNLTLQLRCCVVASLPSRTARSYHLRRRIALETFVPKDDQAKTGSDWLGLIHRSLQSREEFDIKESTDFDVLLPMIEALDIAVSAGFTDYNELHTVQTEHQKSHSGMFAKPQPLTQAARSHNTSLDAIVTELQYMKSKIQHEATHLRRQEVKAALDRSIARIETSVRTRPKPKKSVFGKQPKQARFDKGLLTSLKESAMNTTETRDTVEHLADPLTDDDLPFRPGIDDMDVTPSPRRGEGRQTPKPSHEADQPKSVEVDAAEESSSQDYHTAYELS